MAATRAPTWTFVKRWSPETKRAFELHLATLRGRRSGHADLDDFLGDERAQPVVLKQAQVLVETNEPDALRAALELLAPLVAPDTRGTTFREALVCEANALAGLGDVTGAVERCLRVVSKIPDRGDEYLDAGATLARHARSLARDWQLKAIATLDLEKSLGTQLNRRDFLFFAELATLLAEVGHPRAAEKRGAAEVVLNALPKREREALAKRWPELVGAFRSTDAR